MKHSYDQLNTQELKTILDGLMTEYNGYIEKNLALDMSRGKPNGEQLDLAMGMLDTVSSTLGVTSSSGVDCRNYGNLEGVPEVRTMLAAMLEVAEDEIMIGGNSSLNLMFDAVSRALTVGVYGSTRPWCKEKEIKFVCPSPGYDRHFAICEYFGITMIPVEMTSEGPDMDQVAALVNNDPAVKGMWCVPKYSNPTGVTYSLDVLNKMAALTPAANDFRIFYDNAYAIHGINDTDDKLEDLFKMLKDQGKEDMIFIFGSTSKISFAGAGISAMGASRNNIALTQKQLGIQTIGYDKIGQLMHARFFKDLGGLRSHMDKHGAIMEPKFVMVQKILAEELEGLEIATWTKPNGGYFICLDTLDGCAKKTVALCSKAGVKLTPAGATYPYGIDPRDKNIRIAPSYPSVAELSVATKLLTLATKITAIEYYLSK